MPANISGYTVTICGKSIIITCMYNYNIIAQNVLVFDGGRTVKLADFSAAVSVGEIEITSIKTICPYFAAPELIKGEKPKFSADIWNVLCTLIEMLTARYPGHHHAGTDEVAMMFLVKCCVCMYMCMCVCMCL